MRQCIWLAILIGSCTQPKTITLKTKEIQLYQLKYALQDTTVEQRLRNLLTIFGQGHFVTSPTLLALAGITSQQQPTERDDITSARQLISNIGQITRAGDAYVIRLSQNHDFRHRLFVYGHSQGQFKRHIVDLHIAANAQITIHPANKGLKINAKGIKAGIGILKLDVPALTIRGDYAYLLGIKINLARSQ